MEEEKKIKKAKTRAMRHRRELLILVNDLHAVGEQGHLLGRDILHAGERAVHRGSSGDAGTATVAVDGGGHGAAWAAALTVASSEACSSSRLLLFSASPSPSSCSPSSCSPSSSAVLRLSFVCCPSLASRSCSSSPSRSSSSPSPACSCSPASSCSVWSGPVSSRRGGG